eukprot:gene3007-13027_t
MGPDSKTGPDGKTGPMGPDGKTGPGRKNQDLLVPCKTDLTRTMARHTLGTRPCTTGPDGKTGPMGPDGKTGPMVAPDANRKPMVPRRQYRTYGTPTQDRTLTWAPDGRQTYVPDGKTGPMGPSSKGRYWPRRKTDLMARRT